MIRNFKILAVAVMALAALGAIASGAQAKEFHCSLTECRLTASPDGTGKNAHHVFIVENETTTESASLTCNGVTGEARVGKNATEATVTNIVYSTCNINGSGEFKVDMNKCDYNFTASGEVHVECVNAGENIELTVAGGCVFSIPPGRYNQAAYATVGTSPNREVTLSVTHVTVPGITGNAACDTFINHNQKLVGTYTTGNTLVTGETETGKVMADAWFE